MSTSDRSHSHHSPRQSFFLDMWYAKRWYAWLLLPVSWVYQLSAIIHQWWQKKRAIILPVPVIIVGNITVGGTGKTPVIIALARSLTAKNVSVGIISRGYGSRAPYYPYPVSVNDLPHHTGDEPLLIARATQCPVMIGSHRVAAAQQLLAEHDVDIILSDDGLQHHRLSRDIEIVVVDSQRGLGNHFCLPAGPLREPAKRLASVDWILINRSAGHPRVIQPDTAPSQFSEPLSPSNTQATKPPRLPLDVTLQPMAWRHVASQTLYPLAPLPWVNRDKVSLIHTIAGIGNPQRFFSTIEQLAINSECYAFDDHHQYIVEDFSSWTNATVLMTEKDAVKCQALMSEDAMPADCWSLVVEMDLPDPLIAHIFEQVNSV
ncbi:MAG: tetraacyldisaccharide 4'-kinase [Candidatus Endobugula sp.]|jgi:tetraacyldisaccharide 4'-kinase